MIDIVGKIGSMALVDKKHGDIDYNKFAMIGHWLKPGTVWVTSGAVEIGRLDYIRRHGSEATGSGEEVKADYSSQGQAIVMEMYRRFVDPRYSVRQVLVEHDHFNNDISRPHILSLLKRASEQSAIPIVNYNDAVAVEELRKTEIMELASRGNKHVVELVDNDETAAQIACLTGAKTLLILSTLDGVYRDIHDPASLIKEITGTKEEVLNQIEELKKCCHGASRAGANGAFAKLEYIKPCVLEGIEVIIGSANHDIRNVLNGTAPRTFIKAHA